MEKVRKEEERRRGEGGEMEKDGKRGEGGEMEEKSQREGHGLIYIGLAYRWRTCLS
jgi:hypothetical protein